MVTLTTSPQVIGEHTGTQHTRLYAWYDGQSGNSCTVHFKLTVVYEGITYTGTNKQRCLRYDGYDSGTIAYGDAPLNANQEYKVMEGSRSYNGGSTVNASALYWSYVYGSSDIGNSQATVPNFAPTGLGIDTITRGIESFTARVYLSGWGRNSGTGQKYRELQVWTKGMSEPRRYQPQFGNDLSGTITCGNSSSGSLTIRGNMMYTLGAYASNGDVSTGSQNMGDYTTRAYAPTLSVNTLGENSVVIAYSTPADGGKYAKSVQYSLDGGSTWTTGATVNTGSASSGTFTISGLTDDTSYTLKCRVSTSAGETNGSDVIFRTLESHKLYGSVGGVTKKAKKLYGSVNGQSKEIKKLYASINGQTKRIF